MGEDIAEWPPEPACWGEEREGRSSSLTAQVSQRDGRRKLWLLCRSAESRSNTVTVYISPDTQLDHFREGRRVFVCLRAVSTLCREVGGGSRNGSHMA